MLMGLMLAGAVGIICTAFGLSYPPTEPVYHCYQPQTLSTEHRFDACSPGWALYNVGDEPWTR